MATVTPAIVVVVRLSPINAQAIKASTKVTVKMRMELAIIRRLLSNELTMIYQIITCL